MYENGARVKKVKRFLTRSIKDMYNILVETNPMVKIGKSKFYSLRLKWVIIDSPREVCVCIYCANYELCLITLMTLLNEKSSNLNHLSQMVFSSIMCSSASKTCIFGECELCPGSESLTIAKLNIPEDKAFEEVTFALWNNNDLEKITTSVNTFLKELRHWSAKANTHKYVKNIQKEEIIRAKEETKNNYGKIVIHCDFAEN